MKTLRPHEGLNYRDVCLEATREFLDEPDLSIQSMMQKTTLLHEAEDHLRILYGSREFGYLRIVTDDRGYKVWRFTPTWHS